MNKTYIAPRMIVVKTIVTSGILIGSDRGIKSVTNSDGLDWQSGGFDDDIDR